VNEGFRWCPHCGRPHSLRDRACAATGKPLDNVIHQRSATPPARTPPARSPLLGAVLDGKYRILRAIGYGGMGTVFEAENLALKRLVAVKVVSRPDSEDALARFAREAAIVSSIQHPNICDVHDVGVLPDGGPYIVLERLQGDTLHARLQRPIRAPVTELVDIFVQILSGLHAAHASRILHRDLKPQNVFLVDRAGCGPLVKIVDFGLARDLSATNRLTKPGRLCGTVQYMSPEQLRGEALDQRSDLFSVAVLLYESLTRRHPFAAPTAVELQTNILRADPVPLRSLRPDVPAALEDMVAWAMARSPAQRPSSALELQRGLLSAVRGHVPAEDAEPVSLTNPMWVPPSSSPAA
jgi:eukaryotic-like serine/threonine-protein kinase